ncbi:MAG: hypothetical protein KJZ93_14870 [Caldilineaceae bacterium]|nr:hypothetical protein [Caldilineaceae bacterium]
MSATPITAIGDLVGALFCPTGRTTLHREHRDYTENTEKNLCVLCVSSVFSVFLLYAAFFIVRRPSAPDPVHDACYAVPAADCFYVFGAQLADPE